MLAHVKTNYRLGAGVGTLLAGAVFLAVLGGVASGRAAPAEASKPADKPAEVADNKVEPTSSGEALQARVRGLFDAIVADDPALAETFWFPEAPFVALKDIKEPASYWRQLHRAYARDVHVLHGKRKSWEGAKFERFEVVAKPKWVEPGKEANKLGYYRSLHAKLHYTVDGHARFIDVHTVITWQGAWYVTHLNPFR